MRKRCVLTPRFFAGSVCFAAFALSSTSGFATDTWQGGGSSTDWSDTGNWSNTAVPANGEAIILAQSGTYAPSNLDISVVASSLTLSTASDLTTFANGYSVSSSSGSFTLQSGGSIVDNAANNAADRLNFGIALNGSTAITVSSGATGLVLGGAITGTGGVTVTNHGSSALQFLGNDTYGGGTTISAGTLMLGNGGTTGAISGDVSNNGSLAFNRSDSVTFGGAISGSGSVQQVGSGTTLLTGSNSYTGGTVISNGTLQLGAYGTSGSITGNVTDNGSFAIARSDNVTVDYVISGSGSFQQLGGGITTITATETYGGGTTVSAGTLQIGSGGTTGSITGDVTDNGTLAFNRSDTITFAGAVTGTGSVSQIGSGTTILTGSNDYSSGTSISSGTLQVGAGGTAGSITGAVDDNSGLAFDRSDSVSFDGTISGIGTLSQIGSGTTILTSTASMSGGTTISAGTLQIGNGGTAGTLSGDVVDDATLAFDRSDSSTFGGAVSGTGVLSQIGTGTTVLTGDSTYGGGTTISAGTLQIGNGATTGSITGNVSDGGTLAFDRSDTYTFDGVISGSGTVTQIGTGTTILTGDSTFNGNTTITGGKLQLGNGGTSGSIQGDIANSKTLIVDRSDSVTLDGVISGTGQFQQIGNGTTILTGNSTYGGLTTITAGRLQLGNGGTSGLIASTVSDNAAMALNRSDSFTLVSSLSGTGTLTQAGSGTAILSGDITITGLTTVSAGTLQIGDGTTLGTLTGDIADNATLAFDHSDSYEHDGAISGTGAVVQAGTGMTVLTADNTYTGGTTISAGTLELGLGGTTGSVTGAIVDNASLIANRAGTLNLTGVISGTGSFQQVGTGTTVMTASNTYGGGTIISIGTLQLGNGGTTGTIAGNVTDNGTLAFDRSDTLVFAGAISGSGGVTQSGSGTTVLTGTDTYTGATTILAGTLQVGNGGIAGSIGGAVTDSGTLAFDRSDSTSFGGVISGSGSVTKAGAGTLTLTANNSFSGTTTISAGTLQLGSGSTAGSVAGDVVDNGNLTVNHSNALTLAGNISGTGSLTQAGTGKTILTGSDTYGGGTTISAGTLQIGNGGLSGSIAGDIADNGALAFDRSDTLTVAGTISGTGSVTQTGTGTTILTADNTYTGGTTISSGNLQLGNGGTTGWIAGNVVDNGMLTFDHSDDVTFLGDISGTGSVVLAGSGKVVLGGNNSFTGGIQVGAAAISISSDAGLGNSGNTLTLLNGSTVYITASATFTHNVAVSGDPTFNVASGLTATWSGAIADGATPGVVKVDGGGTFVLANASNSYSGGTAVFGNSTLAVGADGALGAANGGLTLGDASTSGTLQLTASFDLGTSRTVLLASGGGAIDTNGFNATVAQGIGGLGGLTKLGSGTLVLAGTNTYAGGTTVSDGTLQIGNGGTTGSVTGNITDNANLAFDRSDTVTFGAIVSGTGTLIQAGSGTLVLTAANTYTGGTTVSAGTLQIGNGSTTGSIAGDVTDNATLAFDRSDSFTFAGAISGSGAVVQSGNGTTALTGANSYTGNTTISSGTLQIGNGGTSGSIASNITDNATLAFDRSDALTVAGNISGTGGIAQIGSGTTSLTGDATQTGGTTISSGTLQIGSGGTSGSIVGDVTDNATLAFNRTDTLTFSGVVSGTGNVVQAGTGTTILTADQSYSGGTTVSAGTLQLGNGGTSGAIAGNVTDNGTLAFNRSDSFTYAGAISGTGGIAQNGSGTTILSGSSNVGGPTAVNAGRLQIAGSLASSPVTVNAGGTLQGAGTIGSTVVKAGGTITPGVGSSVGTLHVSGTLALNTGATYAADVTTAHNDLLDVSGAATVGGTLIVNAVPGAYVKNQVVTLVSSAGALSGTFASLTINGGFANYVKPTLKYNGTSAYLLLAPNLITPLLPSTASDNVKAVSGAIDAILQTSNTTDFNGLFSLSGSQLSDTLSQMSGEIASGAREAGASLSANFMGLMLNPSIGARGGSAGSMATLAFAPLSLDGQSAAFTPGEQVQPGQDLADGSSAAAPELGAMSGGAVPEKFGVWASGYGNHENIDASASSTGAHDEQQSQTGLALGADWRPNRHYAMGVALGFANLDWDLDGLSGSGRATAIQTGAYASKRGGHGYASIGLVYSSFSVKTLRTVTLGGTNTYAGSYDASSVGGRFEFGQRIIGHDAPDSFWIYGAVEAERFSQPAYSETTVAGSAAYALSFDKQTKDQISTDLGLRYDAWAQADSRTDLHATLAWRHLYSPSQLSSASFSSGTSFTVMGAPIATDSAVLSLGADANLGEGLLLGATFTGGFGENSSSYGGSAVLRYSW